MTFLRRLLYLLRNRRMEAEFAEELETHRLLAQQRELQAGAADAAAASRRAMGNVTLAREDARAQWIAPWLDSVWQDGMYALRGFRRAPAFTGAFVLVMALGVGATTAVFALVDGLVLRDLPVNRPDRLVYFSAPSFSYPIFTGVQARSTDVLTSVAAWSIEDEYVAWSQQLEPSEVLTASGGFYDTLGVTAAVGRTFSDADDRIGGGSEGRVAVISYSAWQRRYGGNPGVVGRTVRVGPDTYTIVGVTPRAFFGVAPGVAPEITIPLTSNARPSSLQSATSSWVHLIGRLRDGVSLAEANTALQHFWPAVLEGSVGTRVPADRRESFLGRQTSIESARAGFSRVRNRFARPLWFLFALVALLLVVAAASAANLLLARGAGRRREIAVRLAIGAGRGRLVRQMLTESMVLTTIAAAAGLLIAKWGAGSLLALMTTREQVITLDAGISNRIVLFSLGRRRDHLSALFGDPGVPCHACGSRVRPQGCDRHAAHVRKRAGVRTNDCRGAGRGLGPAARERDAVRTQPVRRALTDRRRRSSGAGRDRRRGGRGLRGRARGRLLPAIAGARAQRAWRRGREYFHVSAAQRRRRRLDAECRHRRRGPGHGRRRAWCISTPSRPATSARPG